MLGMRRAVRVARGALCTYAVRELGRRRYEEKWTAVRAREYSAAAHARVINPAKLDSLVASFGSIPPLFHAYPPITIFRLV